MCPSSGVHTSGRIGSSHHPLSGEKPSIFSLIARVPKSSMIPTFTLGPILRICKKLSCDQQDNFSPPYALLSCPMILSTRLPTSSSARDARNDLPTGSPGLECRGASRRSRGRCPEDRGPHPMRRLSRRGEPVLEPPCSLGGSSLGPLARGPPGPRGG